VGEGRAVIEWALVFAAMFALDYVWARYTAHVADKRAGLAGAWAIGICLLSGFVTTKYVHDAWLLLPAALGAFGGTWAAIEWQRRG
jgi:NAD/NADP transhydrogenase alpha subunit